MRLTSRFQLLEHHSSLPAAFAWITGISVTVHYRWHLKKWRKTEIIFLHQFSTVQPTHATRNHPHLQFLTLTLVDNCFLYLWALQIAQPGFLPDSVLTASRWLTVGASLACSAKLKILNFSARFSIYQNKSEESVNLQICIHWRELHISL